MYSPTGHLLYVSGRTLYARRFDPAARRLSGEPVPAGFNYASNTNAEWLTVDQLRELLPDA